MFEKIKELIVESLGIEEDQVTMEAVSYTHLICGRMKNVSN